MLEMNIQSAQYIQYPWESAPAVISAVIDDVKHSVPMVEGNRHYDEIMRQVAAGTLAIQAAE